MAKRKARTNDTVQESTPGGWLIGPVSAQRKSVRKAILDAVTAFEEACETHQPIIGYRPRYPPQKGKGQ